MEKVLLAVDDPGFGTAIADFVIRHNWPEGTEFVVLHVVEPLPPAEGPASFPQQALEEDITRGQELIKQLAESINSAFYHAYVVDCKIEKGSPPQKILHKAKEWKADMIVMGSHGRHGLQRLVMGSVSQTVTSDAPCSVMVVRLKSDKAEPGGKT